MKSSADMNEKELKQKVYEFGFEVARYPSDENIRELKGLLLDVRSLSTNKDVNSKALSAIRALDQTIKFKTIERRKKDFPLITDYISRVAHYS